MRDGCVCARAAAFSREVFLHTKINPRHLTNLGRQFAGCSFMARGPAALGPPREKKINRPRCTGKKQNEKCTPPRRLHFLVGVATATSTTKRHRESKFLSLSFISMCLRSLQGISIGKERCTTVGKRRGGAPGSSGEHLATPNATNYNFSQNKKQRVDRNHLDFKCRRNESSWSIVIYI